MSTDWNVHCLDCKSTHEFRDANWRDVDMAQICKHAAALAALVPLIDEVDIVVEYSVYGRVDVRWFAAHATHRLVPISEYGYLLDQCPEYVLCECGSNTRCTAKVDHDGAHTTKKK